MQHLYPEEGISDRLAPCPSDPPAFQVLLPPPHSLTPAGLGAPGLGLGLGLALGHGCTRRSRALPLRPSARPPPTNLLLPSGAPPPLAVTTRPALPFLWLARFPRGAGPLAARNWTGGLGQGWGRGSRGPAGGGEPRVGRQGATGGHFGGVMVGLVWPPPPGSRSRPPGHLLAPAGKQSSASAVLGGNLCLARFLPFTCLCINQIVLMSFCRGYLPGPQTTELRDFSSCRFSPA